MTTLHFEGVVARAIDQSLSILLAMIDTIAENPQVQHLGTVVVGFVFFATMSRSLGLGR